MSLEDDHILEPLPAEVEDLLGAARGADAGPPEHSSVSVLKRAQTTIAIGGPLLASSAAGQIAQAAGSASAAAGAATTASSAAKIALVAKWVIPLAVAGASGAAGVIWTAGSSQAPEATDKAPEEVVFEPQPTPSDEDQVSDDSQEFGERRDAKTRKSHKRKPRVLPPKRRNHKRDILDRNEETHAEQERAPEPVRAEPEPVRTTLAAETALLNKARTALGAKDVARARKWLARHQQEHPAGQLSEEREALRVRIVCVGGDAAAAGRALARFERRFPGSILTGNLRKLVKNIESQ